MNKLISALLVVLFSACCADKGIFNSYKKNKWHSRDSVYVDFQEYFEQDTVVVVVIGGDTVFNAIISTDELLGDAGSFVLPVREIDYDIYVTKNSNQKLLIHITPEYQFLAIESAGKYGLTYYISSKPFVYW